MRRVGAGQCRTGKWGTVWLLQGSFSELGGREGEGRGPLLEAQELELWLRRLEVTGLCSG